MPPETFQFLTPEIKQSDLVLFAEKRVNLGAEQAKIYREQVDNLRQHLDRYISEHPDMGLVKMQLSGSLAKGTSLKTINDVDVALYVKGDGAPSELATLLQWLVGRLQNTFHQIPKDKIYVDGPCIVIEYSITGITVEVAPILYAGDEDGRGYLWDRSTGKKILTSIPLHLKFIRARKEKQPTHFAQTIRLLKWWAAQRTMDTPDFQMRSFLIELIMAKLADEGKKFENYHDGIEHFFVYIQNTGLKERIAFTDYYSSAKLPAKGSSVVEIFDPVNPENNVAGDMAESSRLNLVQLADTSLDALSYARNCQTKGEAIECWRELMGTSFDA